MRDPKPEELAAIKALLDEHGDLLEAAQQKEAEINHAIHALKRQCEVSRTPGEVLLDVSTWRWMEPAGKDAQGNLINKLLIVAEETDPPLACPCEAKP